jgi:hypothetical protein
MNPSAEWIRSVAAKGVETINREMTTNAVKNEIKTSNDSS